MTTLDIIMANLIVRNIDEKIVNALKSQAGRHGISAEAEHRRILEIALQQPERKSFAEVLKSIPAVGEDSDFMRKDNESDRDVFA